jgi:uncharacterized protein (DUF983 family)
MKRDRNPILKTLLRCLRLRCPACGQSSIVQSPFIIKHHCSSCDTLFMREEGFFAGAMLVNIITTEIVVLAIYLIHLLLIGSNYELLITVLFTVGLVFPIAFYHYSWSVWLNFNHLVEALPKHVKHDLKPD